MVFESVTLKQRQKVKRARLTSSKTQRTNSSKSFEQTNSLSNASGTANNRAFSLVTCNSGEVAVKVTGKSSICLSTSVSIASLLFDLCRPRTHSELLNQVELFIKPVTGRFMPVCLLYLQFPFDTLINSLFLAFESSGNKSLVCLAIDRFGYRREGVLGANL
jgi:hypothetical protein